MRYLGGTPDFENAVQPALHYLTETVCHRIGLLTGQERTTDLTETIPEPRLRAYSLFCIETLKEISWMSSGTRMSASCKALSAPIARLSLAAK